MSQWSTVRHSRTPWKHQATPRADDNRYGRTQLARVKHERDRTAKARKETLARLRHLAAQSQGRAVQAQEALLFFALPLFVVARRGWRAVSRVLR